MQDVQSKTTYDQNLNEIKIQDYHITTEPFYVPTGDEINLFESACRLKLPVLLKGPTGCGKTRFLEYMAWKLSRPLVVIACHEDLTATDLIGRYLLRDNQTIWQDGPLSLAVKHGAFCYLDEVVEARKDTTVVIHPLTDSRRLLPQEKRGLLLKAHPDFLMIMSYNPGYQSIMKELKHSTRQRFLAIDFTYPQSREEQAIIKKEGQVDEETADRLVKLGTMVRNLRQYGLEEGVSTRLLIYAALLISDGVTPLSACDAAVTRAMTDDIEIQEAITEIIAGIF